ncbi:MAG: hypothetical protein KME14_25790 [Tildeniella torsiva UHER 1998/13D]|jgi:hypothetical protein|nr:hypothetical protein [Tildeniella torsiva UHER 1998/13D]
MISGKRLAAAICIATAISLAGCGSDGETANSSSDTPDESAATEVQETQVENVKPAPGTGNVQGKVLYNSQPAVGIEVQLCEQFSQFVGGCDGKIYEAKTDENGEYVITDVEPKVYQALLARVFDTDSYVFLTTGVAGVSSAEYDVAADKTLFADTTNLFKGDLKLVNPKAGAKVSAEGLELQWEAYPDAAYYKFNIYPEEVTATADYIGERVDGTSFVLDNPLQKGVYRWQVEAYNDQDQKLSESSSDIKFTVN